MSYSEEDYIKLVTERDEIFEMLRWNHGILAVLIQEAGGIVHIPEADLAAIDINKSNIIVKFDDEAGIYIVEGKEIESK